MATEYASRRSLEHLRLTTELTLLMTLAVLFNQLLLVAFLAWKFHLATEQLSQLSMALGS